MAVYLQICVELAQKLKADGIFHKVLLDIQKAESVDEKLKIIEHLRQNEYLHLPAIPLKKLKNNENSTKYRHLGNHHFALKTSADYLKALEYYNKSMCFAETTSNEGMGLALANRSAVYYALEMYDDCLDNIKLAKKSGYPTHLMYKLDNREEQCLKHGTKKITQKHTIEPKLSFPANPQIPFIANCLQLQQNEQYGRHVITTADLKVMWFNIRLDDVIIHSSFIIRSVTLLQLRNHFALHYPRNSDTRDVKTV